MKVITYPIKLLEPLLATQPVNSEPNSSVTYLFIPGSMLRGALIRAFLQGNKELDRALFFEGGAYFLNAHPLHAGDKRRMLPCPLSWLVKKDDADETGVPVYDFAVTEPEWKEPMKAPGGAFCWLGDETVQLGSPAIQVAVHNASDDRERKFEGKSTVYRYDALAAGQVFGGAILVNQEAYVEPLKELLSNARMLLGGSHTAGYGAVEIDNKNIKELSLDEWEEEPMKTGLALDNGDVVLTCLSDVIFRRKDGNLDADLSELAGRVKKRFRRVRLVGGFNRTWGLPAQQEWAIEAGSVFVFDGKDREKLERFVWEGIGERRVEGFGRIALNLNSSPEIIRTSLKEFDTEYASDQKLEGQNLEFVKSLVHRRAAMELEKLILQRVADMAGSREAFRNLPRPAQIMRVRSVARQAWRKPDLTLLQEHFKRVSRLTMRSWENAQIKKNNLGEYQSLKTWILESAVEDSIFTLKNTKMTLAGEKVQLTQQQRDRGVAILIDRVLKQAAKYARAQEGKGGGV